MANKKAPAGRRVGRLGELIQKAGIYPKSPDELPSTSARNQEQSEPKQRNIESDSPEEIAFFEAMDGVERIVWNKNPSSAFHPSCLFQRLPE